MTTLTTQKRSPVDIQKFLPAAFSRCARKRSAAEQMMPAWGRFPYHNNYTRITKQLQLQFQNNNFPNQKPKTTHKKIGTRHLSGVWDGIRFTLNWIWSWKPIACTTLHLGSIFVHATCGTRGARRCRQQARCLELTSGGGAQEVHIASWRCDKQWRNHQKFGMLM